MQRPREGGDGSRRCLVFHVAHLDLLPDIHDRARTANPGFAAGGLGGEDLFGPTIGLNPRIRQRALVLAEQATRSTEINGRPDGVAAISLYFAGQESDIRLTQATISETAELNIKTIRR